jgi:hypothetical protein
MSATSYGCLCTKCPQTVPAPRLFRGIANRGLTGEKKAILVGLRRVLRIAGRAHSTARRTACRSVR